jgi:putative Holliday junction resolvase
LIQTIPNGGSTASENSVDKPRRILAVDYGRKRIGLALSDELGLTARPLTTMRRTNRQNDMKRLREICRRNGVCRIIVGHPLHLTGEAGAMAEEALGFARRLEKAMDIEVELRDERLTSWEAQRTVTETRSGRPKESPLDDVAAAILLRDYLEQKRDHGHSGSVEKD